MGTLRFITIYPQLIEGYLEHAMMKRAHERGGVLFEVVNLRDYAIDHRGTVDSKPYGGGEGMVMRADVLEKAMNPTDTEHVITTSPGGEKYFCQREAEKLFEIWQQQNLCFICGRFSGIDERFLEARVHQSYSLGDFVASGGELPCLIIAETLCRLVAGPVGNPRSIDEDSYGPGLPKGTLRAPLYTTPRVWQGKEVPKVLLSGHHENIHKWHLEQRRWRTEMIHKARRNKPGH